MISPFEVYLVMQLDTIKTMLAVAVFVSFVWLVVVGVVWMTNFPSCFDENGEKEARVKKSFKRILFMCFFLATLNSVTPSTKTAAAMIIIPALTSEKVVDEASELYNLAKDALRDSLDLKEGEKK